MNYRHIYMAIISHAQSEQSLGLRPKSKSQKRTNKFKDLYFEFHHVLPRSLFPKWEHRQSNVVALTAREHFFCHQLLHKVYPGYQMAGALWQLSNDKKHKLTSKEYARIKEIFAKEQAIKKQGCIPWNKGKTGVYTEEQIKRFSETRKNATTSETIKKIKFARAKQDMSWRHDWHPSDEARQKMRESHLGKLLPDEQKRKMSLSHKNYMLFVKESYKLYKKNNGALTWNDFQKALKNGEIIV